MKSIVIAIILFAPFVTFGQFFSGQYKSEPQLGNIETLKIQHPAEVTTNVGSDITLLAFADNRELLNTDVTAIHGAEAKKVIDNFGQGQEIMSVYKFKMNVDGKKGKFFLLGYLDEGAEGKYILVKNKKSDDTELYQWAKINQPNKGISLAKGGR